jgi:hypothetical protein
MGQLYPGGDKLPFSEYPMAVPLFSFCELNYTLSKAALLKSYGR